MEKKFYLDTSVWIDYLENRKDILKPLGEFAFQFLKKCRKEKARIIVSDTVEKELLNFYSQEKINELFFEFSDLIEKINYTEEQYIEAKLLWKKKNKKFPIFDILHSIIARDQKAVLISRDKHFNEIGIAECFLPEEIY